jgi:hypothetical protein
MAKSIPELLNNRASRDRILAKATANAGRGGLLDMIPACGPDGQPPDSEKDWTNLGRAPRKEEMDDRRTSTQMRLKAKAILKDGARVKW